MTDYLSLTDANFNIFFKRLIEYLGVKCTGQDAVWTHIPNAERVKLNAAWNVWYLAYQAIAVPHTKVETKAKNGAKLAAKKAIRSFVNRFLWEDWEIVTDEDRLYLGIPLKDKIATPVPPPESQCEADLTFPGIHLVELQKIRPVAGTAPEARSEWGARIYYGLSGAPSEKYPFRLSAPPATIAELPYSVFTRKKKKRFDFEGESGRTIWFMLRYENGKGDFGPSGPLLSATIP